ncbi:hypothetical protein ACFLT2_11095 [Acidobacteriota bacterium]
MNRKIYWATVLLTISLMESCVSFKIQPSPDPENQVDTIVLCKRIEQREGLLFPGESLVEFKPDFGPIHCFIRLKNVNQTIRLKWKWYAPEGRLYRETKEVIVNSEPIYLEVVTAYDQIELKPEEFDEGWWTVVVWVNGKLIGRRTFQLVGNGSPISATLEH